MFSFGCVIDVTNTFTLFVKACFYNLKALHLVPFIAPNIIFSLFNPLLYCKQTIDLVLTVTVFACESGETCF